jgi:hypothetical protein
MRDIILIAPNDFGLGKIRDLLPLGVDAFIDNEEGRLSVAAVSPDGSLEFVHDDSLSEHYLDSDEARSLDCVGPSPKFYLVHFRSIGQLKRILTSVANRPDVVIDNDFAVMEPGNVFVERWSSSPDWDWVKE